jgi:hypothetical protein
MLGLLNRRVILLSVLAIASAISGYYYVKANNIHKTIIPAGSVFYTPGQRDNCKWVVHISNQITTEPGDNSSTQIGIPEIITDGYIAGILQNGPGNSLLFAFKLPNQSDESPPIIMTASYKQDKLPLDKVRFRVFGSTTLTMVLYSTFEQCVEATMK